MRKILVNPNSINRETMVLHPCGGISRPGIFEKPSKSWVVSGAVECNNFGSVVKRYSLQDVLENKVNWKYKNGKQRACIVDIDHGTRRVWGGLHEVF